MDFNKEIFFKFLESPDWNHEKTYNLFLRLSKEKDILIEKLEKQLDKNDKNFDELKKITDITFAKYDDCLKLCEKLRKENITLKAKQSKEVSAQTYVCGVKKAEIIYEASVAPNFQPTIQEASNLQLVPSISKLNLDTLWDEAKDIMANTETFKDKNRDLLVLFVDYKNSLIKLMGRDWYKKCRTCVQTYTSLDDDSHLVLYKKMVKLLGEVFEKEW